MNTLSRLHESTNFHSTAVADAPRGGLRPTREDPGLPDSRDRLELSTSSPGAPRPEKTTVAAEPSPARPDPVRPQPTASVPVCLLMEGEPTESLSQLHPEPTGDSRPRSLLEMYGNPSSSSATAPGWQPILDASPGEGLIRTPTGRIQRGDRGAVYYKRESAAKKDYTGIEGTTKLPRVHLDPSPKRNHHDRVGYKDGPLDRPSVYLGGHYGKANGGTEVDTGLSWAKGKHDSHFAFRPFVRVTASGPPKYVVKWQTPSRDVGFAPGEKVKMSYKLGHETKTIYVDKKGQQVDREGYVIDPNGHRLMKNHQPVKGAADAHHVVAHPLQVRKSTLTVTSVDHPGKKVKMTAWVPVADANRKKSFKRVNSVDQFRIDGKGQRQGNERRPAIHTTSTATGAKWYNTRVLTNKGRKVPMNARTSHVIVPSDIKHPNRVYNTGGVGRHGGEVISIDPSSVEKLA